MMIIKIQREKPVRTCTKTYANYTSFKSYIRKDFHKRCGYCDDIDLVHGGYRGYQIDHFKPHSIARFKVLKEDYNNLVYSCPFCNRAKSNKWEDANGFIDPCENEYDKHIARNTRGQIIYNTPRGKYIYKNLNFYLRRHELLWMVERLEEQSHELDIYLDQLGEGHKKEVLILREFRKIQKEIQQYTKLFHNEI